MVRIFLAALVAAFIATPALADSVGTVSTTYTIDSGASAGAAIIDTPGAGTITIGSADVTSVTLGAGAVLTLSDNGESISNAVDGNFDLIRDEDGAVTISVSDSADANTALILNSSGTGAITIDPGGIASVTIGSADVTSVNINSDGGNVTIDGSVLAQVPAASVASGAIAINSVTLATAAADYDIPDGACNAAADVGNWVTIVAEDDTTLISITSDDASNSFFVPGLDIAAGNELDNVVTAAHEGQNITLTCLAAEQWYMTAGSLNLAGAATIAWADGGAAD